MKKFYRIPDKVLINNYTDLMNWLMELPKTKRGKYAFTFSNVDTRNIAFTWKKDALAFCIKFGATPAILKINKHLRYDGLN